MTAGALLFFTPVAAGALCCYYGWARFGWVTVERLHEGLLSVRQAIGDAVAELGEQLCKRFERVDAQLAETAQAVSAVGDATEALAGQVRAVNTTMQSLERRMEPLESNAATAAHGVEVLCELVKTSGLLNNASVDSLRRLDSFTSAGGSGAAAGHAASPELMPPAPRPELLGPPGAGIGSPPTAAPPPVPEGQRVELSSAAPAFLRAVMG